MAAARRERHANACIRNQDYFTFTVTINLIKMGRGLFWFYETLGAFQICNKRTRSLNVNSNMTCFYVCKLITLISFSYLHVGCVSLLDRLIRSGRRPGSLYLTHSEPAETPTPAVRTSQHRQRTGGAERRETCDSGDKSEPMTSHGTMTALSLQCHSLQGTARSRGKK